MTNSTTWKSWNHIGLALTTCTVLGLAMSSPATAAKLYSITDLGTLGGNSSQANGINNLGQVVGQSATSSGDDHAFRTDANSPINPVTDDLGTLGGSFSSGNGINNSGQVVGTSTNSFGGQQAFRTAPNSPINPATDNLGSAFNNQPETSGNSINNLGQVVIDERPGGRSTFAFRTAPNSPINPATDNLGVLGSSPSGGASSYAKGINDLGQVVGSSSTSPNGNLHAFRTAPNQPIAPATDDIGTLGGEDSVALGINNLGQVVGSAQTESGQNHAFRTAANSPIKPATDDLGTLGGASSTATGINNLGQVVGFSETATSTTHAFLYDCGGKIVDLNGLIRPGRGSDFSVLTQANAINDRGQIVGFGNTTDGTTHAFLATPVGGNSQKCARR